jgi:hypothetical protein
LFKGVDLQRAHLEELAMPCDQLTALRRLLSLWLQNCERRGEEYEQRVPLSQVIQWSNVQAVANNDLLREFDDRTESQKTEDWNRIERALHDRMSPF